VSRVRCFRFGPGSLQAIALRMWAVPLHGLHASRLRVLTVERIQQCSDNSYLDIGSQALLIPPRLAVMLNLLAAAPRRRSKAPVARPAMAVPRLRARRALQPREQCSSALAENVDDVGLDAVLTEHCMNLSPKLGADANQSCSHPGQAPSFAHLGRRDPAFTSHNIQTHELLYRSGIVAPIVVTPYQCPPCGHLLRAVQSGEPKARPARRVLHSGRDRH